MKILKDLFNRIKTTHLFKMVERFVNSFKEGVETSESAAKATEKCKETASKYTEAAAQYSETYTKNSKNTTHVNNSGVADRVANTVKRVLAKFGKKFKNEEKSMGKIKKFIKGLFKFACICGTVAFMGLVVYTMIKILPTIIMYLAMAFAVAFLIEICLTVINNAFGVNVY